MTSCFRNLEGAAHTSGLHVELCIAQQIARPCQRRHGSRLFVSTHVLRYQSCSMYSLQLLFLAKHGSSSPCFGAINFLVSRRGVSHESVRSITIHWACADSSVSGQFPRFPAESRYHRSGDISIARYGDLLPTYDRSSAMKKFWQKRAQDIWPKGQSRGCRWPIQGTVSNSEWVINTGRYSLHIVT